MQYFTSPWIKWPFCRLGVLPAKANLTIYKTIFITNYLYVLQYDEANFYHYCACYRPWYRILEVTVSTISKHFHEKTSKKKNHQKMPAV